MKTVLQVAIPPLVEPLEPKKFRSSIDALSKALRGVSAVHTVTFTAAHAPTPEARRAQWLMARQLARELGARGNVHLLATPALLAVDEEIGKGTPPTFSPEWTMANGMSVHYEAYATFVSLSSEVLDSKAYTSLFERVQHKVPYSVISGAPKLWLYGGDAWEDRERIQELNSHLISDGNEDYVPDVILYCSGVPDQERGPLSMMVKRGHPVWFLDADPYEPRIHHLEFPSDWDRRADRQFFRLRIQNKNEPMQRAVRLEVGDDWDQRDLWWSPLYVKVRDQLEHIVERATEKDLSIVTYPVGSYWPEVIPLWCRMVGDPIQHARDGRPEPIYDPDKRVLVVRRVSSELLFPELGKEARKPVDPIRPLAERIRPYVEFIADNLAHPPNSRVRIVLVVHDFDELVDDQVRGGQPEHNPAVVDLDELDNQGERGGKPAAEDSLRLALWRSLSGWRGYRRGDRLATSLVFLFRRDRHQAIRDNLLRVASLQSMVQLLGDPLELTQLSLQRVMELVRIYRRLVPAPCQSQRKSWAICGEFLHPVMDYLLAEATAQFVHLVDSPDLRDSGNLAETHSRLGTAASGAMHWLAGELDAVCGQEGVFFREGCALQRYFEDGPKARTLPLSKVRPVLERIAEKVEGHKILEHIFSNSIEFRPGPGEGEVLNALVDLGYLERSGESYVVQKPLVFLGWSRWKAHGEAAMFQAEAQ